MDLRVVEPRQTRSHDLAVVEEDRHRLVGILLVGRARHPIIAVLGEQAHPLLEAALVEETRLPEEEPLDLVSHPTAAAQRSPHM